MAADPLYTLPAPTTQDHYYLHAMVIELQRIRAALEVSAAVAAGPVASATGAVDLREPKPKVKRGDP